MESAALASVAYDEPKKILYLRFRESGEVYLYFDFPGTEYEALLSAESKGTFFSKRIRNKYRYVQKSTLSAT